MAYFEEIMLCANLNVTIKKKIICKIKANQVISNKPILSIFCKNIGFLLSFDIFCVTGSVGTVS